MVHKVKRRRKTAQCYSNSTDSTSVQQETTLFLHSYTAITAQIRYTCDNKKRCKFARLGRLPKHQATCCATIASKSAWNQAVSVPPLHHTEKAKKTTTHISHVAYIVKRRDTIPGVFLVHPCFDHLREITRNIPI